MPFGGRNRGAGVGANVTLELKDVSKSFAKIDGGGINRAVADVSATFESGELISIVGPSGCGKSTILRMVAGLLFPTTGSVEINGEEVEGLDPQRGFVFQQPALFPWLTVEKNISFSLRMQGEYVRSGGKERVERMLDVIGLTEFRDYFPIQLSGGMAQRVALARMLINEPEVLLLDEPLGALDAFTRMNMQDEILSIWRQTRQLSLMVTHDVDEAVYMGTRVIVMDANPGRISEDIPIELEYPRNRSSSEFVNYRNEILDMLHYGTVR